MDMDAAYLARRTRSPLWAALWMTPGVLLAAWWVFGPTGVMVEVVQQRWRLVIEIDKHSEESASGWCDEMPARAREIERRLLADPAGQRAQPSAHCRYLEPVWRALRSAERRGEPPAPPVWPTPDLNGLPAEQLGAERAGKRHEFYELELRADDGKTWTCRLPQARWALHPRGQRLRLQVDRFGTADCLSLD